MERNRLVQLFNAWMQKYIDHPEDFDAEFQSVVGYLKDKNEGREPSYGESCTAYLEKLDKELPVIPPDSLPDSERI